MDFELSEEMRQIRDTFARYVDERLAPRAAEIDEAHAFPRQQFDEIAALGFFRMLYPEDAGGLGLGMVCQRIPGVVFRPKWAQIESWNESQMGYLGSIEGRPI